ncbi:hypothetical protein BDU57DRAFT_531995 [Ampelomyces quisqualis]|uniref:DUF4470 domain-containing protein n=1 Tax=Ampelomyces quisqualis TaxID=50730 RepID=A0A6A5QBW7_AMPQU|nr:hypothetical protein BDU57DRAFT_531995 [Ampelomyces quisqualis]
MFVPVHLDILKFFYPIGNTPATCFTRNLAREERGDILLLGCGDVRNILFTLHSERNNSRRLDITCCDIEDAVIARNMLLFSVIIADTDGKHQQMTWDIYYHFYLDQVSLQFLNNQARELLSLSTSMEAWHKTLYGRILRFCDLATFTRVRALWKAYSMQDLNEKSRAAFDCLLEASIKRANETREYFIGSKHAHVTTGIRSAAPAGLAYAQDAHKSYQHYWKHGSTNHDPETLSETNLPNPLFALNTIGAPTLHYGTDPLLGFHLATAFTPVECTLPASVDPTRTPVLRVVEAARLQFREWCDAFRSSFRSDLSIRFFTGDAIAFAHALHQLKLSKSKVSRNSYQNSHSLNPIELDGKEYAATHGAPYTFNVIDTSNLIDHVGGLNLLSATSPLLRSNVSSTLYTESLVKREKDHRAYIDTLLCGDFATISLLLDLFPIEYWTNASSTSTADDVMFDIALRLTGSDESGQMHVKLTWKRSGLLPRGNWGAIERKLRFDESDLAHVLHRVYRNMFQHEDLLSLFKGLDNLKLKRNSTVHYHRGSFVFFLRVVKN